ncbi:hypothetical protein KEM52_006329 [Ascosphaera acerosa]|nr:hypothetical protein KEM52_006329 [Ascosphaera acerosa]
MPRRFDAGVKQLLLAGTMKFRAGLTLELVAVAGSAFVRALPLAGGGSQDYHSNALCVTEALLRLYNPTKGLWGNLFWQSANTLSAIADVFALDPNYHQTKGNSIFQTTYENVPGTMNYPGFHNDYNDDMGWWAIAFLNIYDLTKDQTYLAKARDLVDDMSKSSGTPCGELFIQATAGLANRLPSTGDRTKYFELADSTFNWFFESGIVSKDWLVYDGLQPASTRLNTWQARNATPSASCRPTGTMYTYNQGVILGAAAELYTYKQDHRYLDLAGKIADAAIKPGSPFMHDGVFGDACDVDQSCSGDGEEFKGPFVRDLRLLWLQDKKEAWRDFLGSQADSIWSNDMKRTGNGTCSLGLYWAGPYSESKNPSVAAGIGLDAILGAWTAMM